MSLLLANNTIQQIRGAGYLCVGFESIQAKFEARDRDLPKQRNILMRAIEQDLFNDENVLAVFTVVQSVTKTPISIPILI